MCRRQSRIGKPTRARHLREKYGLRAGDWERMYTEQRGACKACGDPLQVGVWHAVTVDHCHETGRVRGLLCGHCNKALGHLKDDHVRAQKLAVYAFLYA